MKDYKQLISFFLGIFLVFGLTSPIIAENNQYEDGFLLYAGGNDCLYYSTELPILKARTDSLFGLVKGKEMLFILQFENKAKIISTISDENEDNETQGYLNDYTPVTSVKSIDKVFGDDSADYHLILTYKIAHSTITIKLFKSVIMKGAVLEITLTYTGYVSDNYVVGWGFSINGLFYEKVLAENTLDYRFLIQL